MKMKHEINTDAAAAASAAANVATTVKPVVKTEAAAEAAPAPVSILCCIFIFHFQFLLFHLNFDFDFFELVLHMGVGQRIWATKECSVANPGGRGREEGKRPQGPRDALALHAQLAHAQARMRTTQTKKKNLHHGVRNKSKITNKFWKQVFTQRCTSQCKTQVAAVTAACRSHTHARSHQCHSTHQPTNVNFN